MIQERQVKESRIMIFNTSSRSKWYGFEPYHMLLYIIGKQPWHIGELHDGGTGYGRLGYRDPDWARDSHAVLFKTSLDLEEEQVTELVGCLAEALEDEDVDKLLKVMIKRMSTMTTNDDNKETIQTLKALDKKIVGERIFEKEQRKVILKGWFTDVIVGPIGITRSLSVQNAEKSKDFMDPITEYVVDEMSTDIYGIDVDKVTILDHKCFYITGEAAEEMEWPKEVMTEFIQIGVPGQYLADKKVRIEKKYKKMYLENYDETKETEYRVCVAKTGEVKFLRLLYGEEVFLGVNSALIDIINSRSFFLWRKSKCVDWDLWSGNKEDDKLYDHRQLLKANLRLKQENEKLKEELERIKK